MRYGDAPQAGPDAALRDKTCRISSRRLEVFGEAGQLITRAQVLGRAVYLKTTAPLTSPTAELNQKLNHARLPFASKNQPWAARVHSPRESTAGSRTFGRWGREPRQPRLFRATAGDFEPQRNPHRLQQRLGHRAGQCFVRSRDPRGGARDVRAVALTRRRGATAPGSRCWLWRRGRLPRGDPRLDRASAKAGGSPPAAASVRSARPGRAAAIRLEAGGPHRGLAR